jgi:hypothetical protein
MLSFPLHLILISVSDDGFKLHAGICRTLYTLEVLSTDIFIYLFIIPTNNKMSYLKIFLDIFIDFFPKLNRHSY